MIYFEKIWAIGSAKFGCTHDLVFDDNQPYLERWIIWLGFTIRLHKFHKGDDDRAFHDHPWWFITMPFSAYLERTPKSDGLVEVKAWRPHFRCAKHRHIVHLIGGKPVWTFIITGSKNSEWGFWEGDKFTPHEAWLNQRDNTHPT